MEVCPPLGMVQHLSQTTIRPTLIRQNQNDSVNGCRETDMENKPVSEQASLPRQ